MDNFVLDSHIIQAESTIPSANPRLDRFMLPPPPHLCFSSSSIVFFTALWIRLEIFNLRPRSAELNRTSRCLTMYCCKMYPSCPNSNLADLSSFTPIEQPWISRRVFNTPLAFTSDSWFNFLILRHFLYPAWDFTSCFNPYQSCRHEVHTPSDFDFLLVCSSVLTWWNFSSYISLTCH